METERIFRLNHARPGRGPVMYWMSREQRAADNHALAAALELARERRVPCHVAFCLAPAFAGAGLRHYAFMLEGLRRTVEEINEHGLPFHLLEGEPGDEVPRLARELEAGAVLADFDPLRLKRTWQARTAEALAVEFLELDSHNTVPCRFVSGHQEWSAFTLRRKITRCLDSFLHEPPPLTPQNWARPEIPVLDWDSALARLAPDPTVPVLAEPRPGAQAARLCMETFIRERLPRYHLERNDPNAWVQSGLSPYLHFGQLAPLRVALEVSRSSAPAAARDAFLEELIVRRELADNYCHFNPDYDRREGLPDWARRSLDQHRCDDREYLYTPEEFEAARTHDSLWNAAQLQMVKTGRMHGFLRMYWAKKILEWSESPETAQQTAIRLNDRYSLDGRDPNGYVGVAWSVGGLHDRPWGRRPVFGTVRYMSRAGCARKFQVERFVESIYKLV
ncbi:deoxyribodipyrimidine photo-lyase [bacterium]|nr:deoxyribodipyrimidine photo-lyase [bacterium]